MSYGRVLKTRPQSHFFVVCVHNPAIKCFSFNFFYIKYLRTWPPFFFFMRLKIVVLASSENNCTNSNIWPPKFNNSNPLLSTSLWEGWVGSLWGGWVRKKVPGYWVIWEHWRVTQLTSNGGNSWSWCCSASSSCSGAASSPLIWGAASERIFLYRLSTYSVEILFSFLPSIFLILQLSSHLDCHAREHETFHPPFLWETAPPTRFL